jgi:hypothetical protein
MTWFSQNKEEQKFFGELSRLPDRAVGLCAVTVVDDRLQEALKARWHDARVEKEQIFDRIFRYNGAAGSFGTRIDLGFAVGLYTEDSLRDLHILRKVRE